MREIPPTAGMPLHWRDLLPRGGRRPFAAWIADILQADHVDVTCSGTCALVVALSVLAEGSARREVVLPAYTCPLVAMAVEHCGLVVRACDMQANGESMDPAALAATVGPRTLAVIPAFLGGRVHDIDPVLACARAAGAWVVEDAAQAFGARHADGVAVGLRGDIGIFSFAAGKGLTLYEGGALVTRHAWLRARLSAAVRALPRRPGWELQRSLQLLGYAALYRPAGLVPAYGWPLRRALRRRDVLAAAGDVFHHPIPLHRVGAWRQGVGGAAAARWEEHDGATRRQARTRLAVLRAMPGVTVIDDVPGASGTWPVLLATLPTTRARDAVLAESWGAGVGISVPFVHALPDYSGGSAEEVPNARAFAARVLSISNSPWLDDATFAGIVACIERAIKTTGPATAPG